MLFLKRKTTYDYDNYGNVIQKKDYTDSTHSIITDIDYTDNHAYIESITKNSATTSYTYDSVGNVITATDGNGNTTSFEYDKFGNIVKTTNPDSSATAAVYDYINNQVTYTDELKNSKRYEYNTIGNLTGIVDVSTGSTLESYTYYAYNLMPETKTTGNESKTKYYYKWDNEVNGYEITAPNSTEILYKEWNEESKVTIDGTAYKKITKKVYDGSTQGATVSEVYYDIFGNMVQSNENNRTIKYTYEYYTTDAIGNILTLKDRAGNTTTYTYDWLGRTMAITDPKGGWTSYTDHNNLVRTEIQ